MYKYYSRFAALGAIATLSACGAGTETGPAKSAPPERSLSAQSYNSGNPAVLTTNADPDRRTLRHQVSTNQIDTYDIGLNRVHNVSGFKVFGGGRNNPMLFEAEMRSGAKAHVSAIVNHSVGTTTPDRMGASATSAQGTLPTSGTATYSGDYVGFVTRTFPASSAGLSDAYITGDVNLTADFAAESVSGSITNRARHLTTTGALLANPSDLNLGQIDLSTARSFGVTSGGQVLPGNSRYVPARGELRGSWQVGFSGSGAQDAVGVINVNHDYLNGGGFVNDDYREEGVFTATKQ